LLAEIDKVTQKGDKRELLRKYQDLEEIYYQGAQMDKVAETIQRSISIFEELGDKHSAGICYGNLATTYLQIGLSGDAGNFDRAEDNCKKALDFIQEGQDKRRQSYLLGSLGNICLHKKDLDNAWEYYSQSLKTMRELGDVLGEARSYSNLGNVRTLQKDWDAAR